MTSYLPVVWFLAGLAQGGLHAVSLWRASTRVSFLMAMEGLLRLLTVAAILYVAAVAGQPLAAAGGWGLGLLVAGTSLLLRSRTSWR